MRRPVLKHNPSIAETIGCYIPSLKLLVCMAFSCCLSLSKTSGGEESGRNGDNSISAVSKQMENNNRLMDKIRLTYKEAKENPTKKNGGVTDDVILAMRTGAIGTGRPIQDLERVFGSDSLIWAFENRGRKVVVIPLDVPKPIDERKPVPVVPAPPTYAGAQMYLFATVDLDGDIADVSLRFGSLNGFVIKGLLSFKPLQQKLWVI